MSLQVKWPAHMSRDQDRFSGGLCWFSKSERQRIRCGASAVDKLGRVGSVLDVDPLDACVFSIAVGSRQSRAVPSHAWKVGKPLELTGLTAWRVSKTPVKRNSPVLDIGLSWGESGSIPCDSLAQPCNMADGNCIGPLHLSLVFCKASAIYRLKSNFLDFSL